jgi:hypothetical protein
MTEEITTCDICGKEFGQDFISYEGAFYCMDCWEENADYIIEQSMKDEKMIEEM